jgi:hypothetical protein
MTDEMLWTIEFILSISVIISLILMVVYTFWKLKDLDLEFKFFYYGIALFLIAFIFARILYLLNDILFQQTGDLSLKQGMYYIVGSIFSGIASFGIMFVIERYVYTKFHYILSLIILIGILLMIFIPRINGTNMITIYNIFIAVPAGLVLLIFLYIGFKTKGDIRKKSFILALGMILLFAGTLFNTGTLKDTYPIFKILSPITIIISLTTFQYGLFLRIEKLPSEAEITIKKSTMSMIKTLGLDLTRREKITEEEVTISREKKICLVCKGKLSRKMYLCPECNTFYCEKCSDLLADLENACWVCDTAFDESKPVKLPKKEEVVVIDEGPGKKGKNDAK